jgi:transposase-like protein
MSVLDQLRALEQQVEKRLRELAPLVAEYRDLEKVAERLGLKRDEPEAADTAVAKPAASAKTKPKPSRSRTRTTQAAKTRAPTRKATPTASKGAAADAASAPRRARAASSRRAKPTPKPAAASRGGTAEGTTTTRSRRNAAAPGQRQQDVLRLVNERPGITVAELAQELGVDATGLYGVVRRLQAKGQINKDGTALRPIAATPTTEHTTEPPPTEPPAAAPSTTPGSPAPPPTTGS